MDRKTAEELNKIMRAATLIFDRSVSNAAEYHERDDLRDYVHAAV